MEKHEKFDKLTYVAALLILGVLGYINFGQNKIWKNGETLWSHVLKYYPSTSLVWENRASYYTDEGRTKEALHDFSKAIAIKPHNAIAYYSRGNLYYNSNTPESLRLALQDYTKAIQSSPGTGEYLVSRGITYFDLDMFENALQDLNAAERSGPANHDIYSYRSRIYFKLGQYDKAQADLEKYLNITPDNSSMWSNLGMIARLNKQYMNSLNAFNRAIQMDPGKLDYYYKRSITYYEMGDIQKARNDLNFLKLKGFKGINQDYERMIDQGK